MELNQVNQAQETQANPIEQAYVSAAYAQGLEEVNRKLREELAILKANINNTHPMLPQLLAALDEHIERKVEAALADQEDNIRQIAEDAAETKITEHTNEYDHYEMECQIERIDDKIEDAVSEAIDDLDIRDKINDALNGATISISV